MSNSPDRAELERVWREEPVGWLKKHIKEHKGKQMFTVVARPYVKQYLDPVEQTVWAKNEKTALQQTWELSKKVREKYPLEQHKDIAWTYGIKYNK